MEGASLEERLVGAVRTNNEDSLTEILSPLEMSEKAKTINTTCDSVGRKLLHIAALYGSYDCLFSMLDHEGIEIDPLDRLEGNTPLHLALKYAERDPQVGGEIVNLLIECGANTTIKNQQGKTPIMLAKAAKLTDIENSLRGAQYAAEMGSAEAVANVGGDSAAFEEETDDEDLDGKMSGEEDVEQ